MLTNHGSVYAFRETNSDHSTHSPFTDVYLTVSASAEATALFWNPNYLSSQQHGQSSLLYQTSL